MTITFKDNLTPDEVKKAAGLVDEGITEEQQALYKQIMKDKLEKFNRDEAMHNDPIFNNNYYTTQGISSVYDNPVYNNPVYDRPVPRSSKLERESVEMQVQPLPDGRRTIRQEHMWSLSSEYMSEPAIKSWMQFLAMASNAHTIDTTIRADSKEYAFQTDFLKYVKWLPVYRNDVTGELQDVAYEHLAKTVAHNAEKSKEVEKLRYALERISKCELRHSDMMIDIAENALRGVYD